MTDQGGGRRQPPPDDRTLLDPLNADELKALRDARQKMAGAKAGHAAGHTPAGGVGGPGGIGPDSGDANIGDAPTRAMPALPQFDNPGVTLEKIPTGSMPAVSRGTPGGGTPKAVVPQPPAQQPPAQNLGQQPGPGGPVAGPTGFGENTLMWMTPPKVTPASTGPGTMMPAATPAQVTKRYLMMAGAAVVLVGIVGGIYMVSGKKERAVVDLHTNPPKASVKINGTPTKNTTPMKLNLGDGAWEIEVSLEGYKTENFTINVDKGAAPARKDIELEPISKEGLLTVSVAVQPVAANITLDGTVYGGKRNVAVANVDPKQPHKLTIEAGGYQKIEQEIPADQLKKTYTFVLQQDEAQKPGGGGAGGQPGQPGAAGQK